MTRPKYAELPGVLDIALIIGKDFGPMVITPKTPEDLTGRTYTATVNTAAGAKLADMVVDISSGVRSITMTNIESAKLTAGVHRWELSYVLDGKKKADFAGNVEASK